MRLLEVERMARSLGIAKTWRYSKKQLIRSIQRTEGNNECFATRQRFCGQMGCCFRSDCIR